MTDLLIASPLDQPLPTDNEWALQRIEAIAHDAVDKKDPIIILDALRQIIQLSKVVGLALAKGFYIAKKYWSEFDCGEEFEDAVFEHTGKSKGTVERYIRVWTMFENKEAPKKLEESLMQRNIKDLIPIANAIDQGYKIDESTWTELAHAPDYNTVSKIVMEKVKNSTRRKGQLTLMLKRDGTIVAHMSGQQENVAWVDLENGSDICQKSVNRLLDNAGVLKQ